MKRIGLIVTTVLTFSLTGVLLARAARADHPAAVPSVSSAVPVTGDVLTGPAGWHYRHSQPAHWRACMLQQ
jgi:hypothetical protein